LLKRKIALPLPVFALPRKKYPRKNAPNARIALFLRRFFRWERKNLNNREHHGQRIVEKDGGGSEWYSRHHNSFFLLPFIDATPSLISFVQIYCCYVLPHPTEVSVYKFA
jgi:hypothetical protein